MGCGACGSAPLPAMPAGGAPPPLPNDGTHNMRVDCTGLSLRGKPLRRRWNSNTQLLWRVTVPEDGLAMGDYPTERKSQDWFYLTTSTDIYHFGAFMDTWVRVRAYGTKEIAAETFVQLSEKEKILRFAIVVGGEEELTLIRCGVGADASISVEPGKAREGDFSWAVTPSEVSRRGKQVVLVQRDHEHDAILLQLLEDESNDRWPATPLLLFMIGFIVGCGFIDAVDVFFRTGVVQEDLRYLPGPRRPAPASGTDGVGWLRGARAVRVLGIL